MSSGWAVIVSGEIDVRSVSPTRRAAIVNWLYLNGYKPLDRWEDRFIEHVWHNSHPSTVDVIEVTINPKESL
jgi:hypothetical protein